MGVLGLTEIVVELGGLFLVTVGIREERVGINDAFVEDDLAAFGFFHGGEGLGVGMTFDFVGVVHGVDAWFVEGGRDVIDDVGLEKVKVQLVLATGVEGEPAYLAFDFALIGYHERGREIGKYCPLPEPIRLQDSLDTTCSRSKK